MAHADTVVVTGGSRGIGQAVVRRLADDGYVPVNLDIAEPEEDIGHFIQVDLADAQACSAVLSKLERDFVVTRLVNNVGAVRPGPIESITSEDAATAVGLNWAIATRATQVFVNHMRAARFGRIVNISSRSVLGRPQRSVYSMTKAGLLGLTRSWALELAKSAITVNVIAPGAIDTELYRRTHPHGSTARSDMIGRVPMRRLAEPSEVAHAVSFLLDERSGYITGQVLYVCGGLSLGALHP